MSKFYKIVLCIAITAFLVETGYGLSCLKCQSTDVESRCRYGQRSKTTKKQICHGPTAKCFVLVTVDEYGSSNFQRGCSLEDVCSVGNNSDIEFCFSCASKHCNYDVIQLDEEVEAYLNAVKEEEIANNEALMQAAEAANTTTVSSVTNEPQHGTLDQTTVHQVNNSSDEHINPSSDVIGKPMKDNKKAPVTKSADDGHVTLDSEFSDSVNFGDRLPGNTRHQARSS